MSAGDLPRLLSVSLAKPVEKQVNAVRRNGLPLIAIKVIDRFQLAGRINQSGNNDVSKEPLRDRAEADLVKEPSKNKFRTHRANRRVPEGLDEVENHRVVVLILREQRELPALPFDEGLCQFDKPPDFFGITGRPDAFEHPITAGLADDLNADASGFIFLLADKHGVF